MRPRLATLRAALVRALSARRGPPPQPPPAGGGGAAAWRRGGTVLVLSRDAAPVRSVVNADALRSALEADEAVGGLVCS